MPEPWVGSGLEVALESPLIMSSTRATKLAEVRNRVGTSVSGAWDERRVAVVDAECQIISGYLSTLCEAIWNLRVEAIDENRKILEHAAEILTGRRKKIATIIAGRMF